jgi:hypothetical protein
MLLPEEETLIHLETAAFLHRMDTHAIRVRDTSQSSVTALCAEVHRLLSFAGPEALTVANQRYRLVEACQNKQLDPAPLSTPSPKEVTTEQKRSM